MTEVHALENKLRKAREAYYGAGSPIMSDAEYDALEDKLRALDPNNWVLRMVGSPPGDNGWEKVKHSVAMGSLNKAQNEGEVKAWLKGLNGRTEIFLSEKLDGISCSLRFVNGKLIQAVTRGDGTTGEDITRNVSIMQGVPRALPTDWTGHVRGEVICTRSAHERHFPDGSNPRNTASGTAKRQSDPDKCRFLTFMLFKCVPETGALGTKTEEMQWAERNGFTIPHFILVNSLERIVEVYEKYQDKVRARLDYDIDGLVLEVNDLQKQDDLGETNGRPAGAIAFKFPHETKETVLEDVVWQVGNTGRITPVAIFETVNLGGANVSRASLATANRFKELNLRRGSRILVARRNDVIPRVEANLDEISTT